MKTSKAYGLHFERKVLMIFENKKQAGKRFGDTSDTDTTTSTITLTSIVDQKAQLSPEAGNN